MVTFQAVDSVDPKPYMQAAQVWRAAAESVRLRADEIAAARVRLTGCWLSRAGQNAADEMKTLTDKLDATNATFMSLDQTLTGHYDGLTRAKDMLAAAREDAAAHGLRISDAGAVERIDPSVTPDPQVSDRVATLVRDAVAYATEIDTATAQALAQLLPAQAESLTPVDPASIPLAGTDPRQVRAWWASLTAAQQRWLIEDDPAAIGRLDGVPAADRDQANRILLEQQQTQLLAQRDALAARIAALNDPANWPHDDPEPKGVALAEQHKLRTQLDAINGKLAGMTAIENRLYQPGSGRDRGYLLLIDTAGNGHAIVATGNPDTANNVVTYVPGMNSRLAAVGHDIDRANIMAQQSNSVDPTKATVGITWLGYDAPQGLVQAAGDSYALHAENDLSRFQDGLRITHDGAPSHNTVIGHSYGSTVVGFTARDTHLNTNDVVFVGSPGVGVDKVAGLHIDAAHVWSSHIGDDPIELSDLGILTGQPDDQLIHGYNPDLIGGHDFASQPTGGHSAYWDPHSQSLINIGYIVSGHPDMVTLQAPGSG